MENGFSRKKSSSLTEEVVDEIIARITSNRWPAGYMIPSETELAAMFDVSQGTVRRALQQLVNDGLLVRHQGKGTFVTSRRKQTVAKHIVWFAKNGDEKNPVATLRRFSFTAFETISASPRTASALLIEPGAPVHHVQRESSYEGLSKVCCFDDIFLPADLFPNLTQREIATASYPDLYAFYEDRFGVSAFTFDELARAVLLTPAQSAKACVSVPYPAICIQRVCRNAAGRPVELRFLTNVTDEQNMVLSIGRHL